MEENKLPEEVSQESAKKDGDQILEVSPAIHSKVEVVIQQGIKIEQDSAQIYEAMGTYLDSIYFPNTAHWFKTHAGEERKHSNWVIKFLEDKNVMAEMPEIAKPECGWKCLRDVLKGAYEHEEHVTNFWNKAATEALKYADHDSYQFCLHMLKEQREELELFSGLIDLYNLSKGKSLLIFDQHVQHP